MHALSDMCDMHPQIRDGVEASAMLSLQMHYKAVGWGIKSARRNTDKL